VRLSSAGGGTPPKPAGVDACATLLFNILNLFLAGWTGLWLYLAQVRRKSALEWKVLAGKMAENFQEGSVSRQVQDCETATFINYEAIGNANRAKENQSRVYPD
jgi:hypothetical protein